MSVLEIGLREINFDQFRLVEAGLCENGKYKRYSVQAYAVEVIRFEVNAILSDIV